MVGWHRSVQVPDMTGHGTKVLDCHAPGSELLEHGAAEAVGIVSWQLPGAPRFLNIGLQLLSDAGSVLGADASADGVVPWGHNL